MRGEAWRDKRLIIGGSDAGAHLDMVNTFALTTQLLGEGVRDRGLLPLEEAVNLITGVPAERFGLTNRGRLCAGMAADVVVFDPETVGCGPVKMRFDLPEGESRLYADAAGIHHVIVNGVPVVCANEPTGAIGGRILRSGRDTQTVHFSDVYPSQPNLKIAG
jgi:N-acyl-D-aspartate/D-glutamate deacylase